MEGLQVQRFGFTGEAYESPGGYWVKFSDAEKFHDQLQEAMGKNMMLTDENTGLREQIDTHADCERELTEGLEKAVKERDEARRLLSLGIGEKA